MAAGEADPPPRIDWIPATDLADGPGGRIGMTVLPGKRGASMRYPGRVYRADLATDVSALHEAGVGRLVLLVDDTELGRWGDPAIVERAADAGLEVVRWPMPDGGTPADQRGMDAILASITEARERGDVAVACMGGVGRTGMVVACALVDGGWTAEAAIARVRQVRHPTAVETAEQERFVHDRERKYQRESGGSSPKVAR